MKRLAVSRCLFLGCIIAAAIGGCNDRPASSPMVSVSGAVTGMTGSAVLQNNGGDSLTLAANGPFSFSMPIDVGGTYLVTVKTQPAGQTCTVSNGSGTAGTVNVTDVALACVTNTQTLGGAVSGLNGNLVLQYNGGSPLTITANGVFVFGAPTAEASPYEVTVRTQPAHQTCTVAHGLGIVGAADITTIVVTCITNAFTVGGAISGLTGSVVLQNNGVDTQLLSTDGTFAFPMPVREGSPYLVTVKTQPAGQTCSVANGAGAMGAVRVTSVVVVCAANTYTIGGSVSGLTGTVALQNDGADSQTINVDGAFQFAAPLAQGGTYSVTIQAQPVAQTCTVVNGSGIVGAANISNVVVTCATNAFTVGGTVSGLSGTLTLGNNGTDLLAISTDGSFTFSTSVAEGSNYNVTAQTQPTGQTCAVSNGSGVMGGTNVANVGVICATANTTISVSSTGVIPVNGASGSLTVTNTGTTYAALNVSAILPGGWTSVTQDSSSCPSIAPNGGTCTLLFTSTKPYVADGNIAINGDNITSSPTSALAFSIDDYLVFSVPNSTTALVVASSDAGISGPWSMDLVDIPGTTETSTAPPCNGGSDGSCDTAEIVAHYGTPYSDYAAGLCYEITADNSGAVALGTWYLPAVCEIGSSGEGAGCPTGIPNIDANLVQPGFMAQLGLGGPSGLYWTASEYSGMPDQGAWIQVFVPGGGSQQAGSKNGNSIRTRCARAIGY